MTDKTTIPVQKNAGSYSAEPHRNFFFQPKPACPAGRLTINQPNDEYEQEADAVADKVMRMHKGAAANDFFFKSAITPVQRKCEHCDEEEKKLQRKELSSGDHTASSALENYVQQLDGGGQPLQKETRSFYESCLGYDFSRVKIHTDNAAAKSAQSINALAYTSGDNIVFNKSQYAPGTDKGKQLLAHELTHVVQQGQGVQMQTAGSRQDFSLEFTEEIIDLSHETATPQTQDITTATSEVRAGSETLMDELPRAAVQTKTFASFVQRTDDTVALPRKDYVFLMGSSGGFYVAAKRFFKDHHPEAEIISLKDNSLSGIFAKLRSIASDIHPVGNLYIVSHANVDGTLSFGLTKKDKDRKTTFGELKNALAASPEIFELKGGIDDQTKVHIKGCNIGRNIDMLDTLDEAFGRKAEIDAPTHKQAYEYHTEGKGKDLKVVSTEYFNTYNVEFSGNTDKGDDELIAAFKEKYADFGFSDQDWEIAVLGAPKQGKKVDKAAAADKKEVDARLKSGLDELDKKAAEYKDEVKRLKEEAKTEKTGIDASAKEAKQSKVAKGSKGVKKKVISPFTATLFDAKLPPLTEPEIIKIAPVWFPKDRKAGWIFNSGSVKKSREDDTDKFTYNIGGDKNGELGIFSYEITMPAFPETDDDAKELAQKQLDKYLEEHPDFAISRRAMFDWRTDRKKGKGKDTIKAFLEMSIYTIDLDLRETTGNKIDPAAKEGEDFFFGESDVD